MAYPRSLMGENNSFQEFFYSPLAVITAWSYLKDMGSNRK